MPADGFLFSIAGLSASLAGLAGLVAGLRRGTDLRPIDAFRLRQIVEFAFANVLISLLAIPLGQILGVGLAIQVLGAVSAVYVVVSFALLGRRSIRTNVRWTPGWRLGAISLGLLAELLALLLVASPQGQVLELLLVALLARPMLVFLLVLHDLTEASASPMG